MASPFTMGLNALATRSVTSYVRNFEVCGNWKEHEVEEHLKMGRVPDENMLLNTLVRVAVEKMAMLDSFRYLDPSHQTQALLTPSRWELNFKMLPTLWHGLAQSTSLTKLTVKCPSNRYPKPITLVPPIPNLEYLHLFDIDPLCYADDISLLLLGSKKLRHLKLHWSPRIREAREPSINQASFFGRCAAAHYVIKLKSMALHNLYTHQDNDCSNVFDLTELEDITFLNSTGGINDNGPTAFMEAPHKSWRKSADELVPTSLKNLRCDKVSKHQCQFIADISNLEKLYLVHPQTQERQESRSAFPRSPDSTNSPSSSQDAYNILSLKDDYLEAITKSHGATIKHLLLLPQWRLTNDDIARLFRHCPNLEQLGIGVEFSSFSHMRLLVPFLPKLKVMRLLGNPDDSTFVDKMREIDQQGLHEEKIGEDTVNAEWAKLRYMEIGAPDMIFELGERRLHALPDNSQTNSRSKDTYRRSVKKRTLEDVKDIAIWKYDSPNI